MTDTYIAGPEEALTVLIWDVLVGAHLARRRQLRPDRADALAARLKVAASNMIEDGDRELLSTTANLLGRVSLRVKAQTAPSGSRAKAARSGNGSRPGSRPEPDYGALARAQDPRRHGIRRSAVLRQRLRGGRASARGGPEPTACGAEPPSRGAASATGRLQRAADPASRMAAVRLPTAASWNANATIESEAREHEAGHAVAAHLLGFEVGEISMDAKWADYGELGRVSFRWAGTISDAEELAFRRAIVAAAGPVVTDSLELASSSGDRAKIAEVRWPAWTPGAWEFLVADRTEGLVRSEAFRRLHRRVVAALEEVGDTGTLSGDEFREVVSTIPDADLLPGSPRAGAAASAASGRSMSGKGLRTRRVWGLRPPNGGPLILEVAYHR